MRQDPDYYYILGVDPSISAEDLQKHHRKLVRELHPDRHGSDPRFHERLTEINVAFYELRDEFRRSAYDRRRREAAGPVKLDFRKAQSGYKSRTVGSRRKRRLFIGALCTLFTSCLVLIGFLIWSSSDVPAGTQPGMLHSGTGTVAQPPKQELEKLSDLTEEALYENKLEGLRTSANATIVAANGEAAALEDGGSTSEASKMRSDIDSLQKRVTAAGVAVSALGELNQPNDEAKLEHALDGQLTALSNDEEMLKVKTQTLKASGGM